MATEYLGRMLHTLTVLVLIASAAYAYRQRAVALESGALRRQLGLMFALALGLRLALELVQRSPAGAAQRSAVIVSLMLALPLFAVFLRLSFLGEWRKGERWGRLVPAVFMGLTLWGHERGGAIFFALIALMRHPWIQPLSTPERFRATLACLVVLVALFFRIERADGLPEMFDHAQDTVWVVRGTLMLAAAFGMLRAFKAFTTDPTLGIRRVSRRLALSHVLVVTVPLLIIVALWISSTYLGVNADRALVTARAVDHEARAMHSALTVALASGEVEAAGAAVATERRPKWPASRVFVFRDTIMSRVAGEAVPGELALGAWVARIDSLPDHGVVQLAGRRWLGAAAHRDGSALVLLVPVAQALDSTLSPLIGARVEMVRSDTDETGADSLRNELRAFRDSLREAGVDRAARDSITLRRARSVSRMFGVPDSIVRATGGSPLVVSTGPDTLRSNSGDLGFTGQVSVKGLSYQRGRWGADEFTLNARASFGNTLLGLFQKVRENPLQAIPIAALAGLALLLLPLARTNQRMVNGMGTSIARGIGALRDGAAAFGAGKLAHRIPIEGDDDLWDTARQFNQMAEGLERARELEKERDRLENELELARRIQARLLPDGPPSIAGLDIAGLSESAREVGGDYFDHIDLGGGRVLLVIADVSGKGVPAALIMSGFRASLMSQDTQGAPPDVVASRVNDFLHKSVDPGKFVTAFFGFLDSATGRFVYVNAGHNPPMLLRNDGKVELLTEGGLILGIMAGSPFTSGEATLAPGELVALYTDGVTEGADASHEQWGEDRLMVQIRAAGRESAAALAQRIVREVRAFEGETGPADDITVLIAKRVAPPA